MRIILHLLFFLLLTYWHFSCQNQQAQENDDQRSKHKVTVMGENNYIPSYLELHREGTLEQRGKVLWERMRVCDLCPRDCDSRRLEGQRGDCNASSQLMIASYGPHFGEEPELTGSKGSGTIFFTHCNLKCVFCINADISQKGHGRKYSVDNLAQIMLELQENGQHNINLVTPSHYIAHIILAIDKAAAQGLRIPIVYNTCGWEKPEVLRYLDGIVDVYLTDFKYGCSQQAGKYSPGAWDYVEMARKAHLEMHRQVGSVQVNQETGRMERGLMIRHLVMPNNVACTEEVMNWIGENLPKDTYVNIMSQYMPVFRASLYSEINRRITREEYRKAVDAAKQAGLTNIKTQP